MALFRLLASRRRLLLMASSSSAALKTNRLVTEKSPYLLQHATNPVDWYPWCEEAFTKAQAENKPIFLSVGYSTCHWCHVMERESFENKEIADVLNKYFISIKVDREERPDVDRVYMTFIQATQGGGGWPMSVFLTPDLKPFIGGTYFPPKDLGGRPGFITLLNTIKEQWANDSRTIIQRMEKVLTILQEAVTIQPGQVCLPPSSCIDEAVQMFIKRFDTQNGGFGNHPKFPQPDFLLRVQSSSSSQIGKKALDMTVDTLTAMAYGGIHDHIGQGFHRYSTDREWHVPHFEKMLYDQSQLACVYIDGYQVTNKELFKDTANDILQYVSRDLTDKDGGFYSAEDADSLPISVQDGNHKKEGAFCVWTWKEVYELLGNKKIMADLFVSYYGMKENGNVDKTKDPHNELVSQNVLIIKKTVQKLSDEFHITEKQVIEYLNEAKDILYRKRQERPKPHRDDKIVTSWNGLMISAFARAARVFSSKEYLRIAEKCAGFIKEHMYRNKDGVLLRSAYREKNGNLIIGDIEGFADDYSSLICALLDLYESSHTSKWIEWAVSLQTKQDQLFWDSKSGGYFNSSGNDKRILLQMKEDQDGSEPSPNSLSAMNLLRLSALLRTPEYRQTAENIFKTFNEHLSDHPAALTGMLSAFIQYSSKQKQIVICGQPSHEDSVKLLEAINSFYIPNKVIVFLDPADQSSFLCGHIPVLKKMKPKNGKCTVYVCEDYQCMRPTSDIVVLKDMLSGNYVF